MQRMELTREYKPKNTEISALEKDICHSTDTSDSGLSDHSPNFQTRTKKRLEKYWTRKIVKNEDGQTEIVLELPSVSDTETEAGSHSPQYQRKDTFSEFEDIHSYLSDEKRSQATESNKEAQRQRKRLIRIGRKQIVRHCPKCFTRRQKEKPPCPQHQAIAQFLKAKTRGQKRCKRQHQRQPRQC